MYKKKLWKVFRHPVGIQTSYSAGVYNVQYIQYRSLEGKSGALLGSSAKIILDQKSHAIVPLSFSNIKSSKAGKRIEASYPIWVYL
jgi:hypothetical protein